MSVECLLDTSVLLHAVSSAPAEAAKKRKALRLIQQTDFALSAEVLREFYVTVTEKIRKPLRPEVAVALLDEYRVFPIVPTDYALIVSAIEVSLLHGLSLRDGLVIAAAQALAAGVIYGDALEHGRRYGDVRAVNPFHDA